MFTNKQFCLLLVTIEHILFFPMKTDNAVSDCSAYESCLVRLNKNQKDELKKLVKEHAPIIQFAKRETLFPSSVEEFRSRSDFDIISNRRVMPNINDAVKLSSTDISSVSGPPPIYALVWPGTYNVHFIENGSAVCRKDTTTVNASWWVDGEFVVVYHVFFPLSVKYSNRFWKRLFKMSGICCFRRRTYLRRCHTNVVGDVKSVQVHFTKFAPSKVVVVGSRGDVHEVILDGSGSPQSTTCFIGSGNVHTTVPVVKSSMKTHHFTLTDSVSSNSILHGHWNNSFNSLASNNNDQKHLNSKVWVTSKNVRVYEPMSWITPEPRDWWIHDPTLLGNASRFIDKPPFSCLIVLRRKSDSIDGVD